MKDLAPSPQPSPGGCLDWLPDYMARLDREAREGVSLRIGWVGIPAAFTTIDDEEPGAVDIHLALLDDGDVAGRERTTPDARAAVAAMCDDIGRTIGVEIGELVELWRPSKASVLAVFRLADRGGPPITEA